MAISEGRMDRLVAEYEKDAQATRDANRRFAEVKTKDPKYAPNKSGD